MYAVRTKRRNRKKSNFCPCYYSRLCTHKLINPFFHLFFSKVSLHVRRNIIKMFCYHVRKINGELSFSKKQDMRRFDLFRRCYWCSKIVFCSNHNNWHMSLISFFCCYELRHQQISEGDRFFYPLTCFMIWKTLIFLNIFQFYCYHLYGIHRKTNF